MYNLEYDHNDMLYNLKMYIHCVILRFKLLHIIISMAHSAIYTTVAMTELYYNTIHKNCV